MKPELHLPDVGIVSKPVWMEHILLNENVCLSFNQIKIEGELMVLVNFS